MTQFSNQIFTFVFTDRELFNYILNQVLFFNHRTELIMIYEQNSYQTI